MTSNLDDLKRIYSKFNISEVSIFDVCELQKHFPSLPLLRNWRQVTMLLVEKPRVTKYSTKFALVPNGPKGNKAV